MPDFLKGNFKPKQTVEETDQGKVDQINEEFERTALKRLGGSIAFVSRKGFMWKGENVDEEKSGHNAGSKSG